MDFIGHNRPEFEHSWELHRFNACGVFCRARLTAYVTLNASIGHNPAMDIPDRISMDYFQGEQDAIGKNIKSRLLQG